MNCARGEANMRLSIPQVLKPGIDRRYFHAKAALGCSGPHAETSGVTFRRQRSYGN